MTEYLSEVFLGRIGTDLSKESIHTAVQECERRLNDRLVNLDTPISVALYFMELNTEAGGILENNPHFMEILDFWDVMKDFDGDDFSSYEIVRLARSVYSVYKKRISCKK